MSSKRARPTGLGLSGHRHESSSKMDYPNSREIVRRPAASEREPSDDGPVIQVESIMRRVKGASSDRIGEARRFYDLLYRGLPEDAYLVVSTNEGGKFHVLESFIVPDLEAAAQRSVATGARADVWVNVCPQDTPPAPGQSGSEDTAAVMPGVWLDLAFDKITADSRLSEDPDRALEAALILLERFGDEPTLIVHSGEGLHVYWLLQEPILLDEDGRQYAKNLLNGIYVYLGDLADLDGGTIDDVADLARAMRVPGTFNYKSRAADEAPLPVKLLSDDGPLYPVEDFEEFLPVGARQSAARTPTDAGRKRHRAVADPDGAASSSGQNPMDLVLERLHERGCTVTGAANDQLSAQCPAHDDRRASLSVSQADDGKVLIKCHAGCRPEDIVGALGLQMQDLFSHEIVYRYEDETGNLLSEVVRYPGKKFRQRRPTKKGYQWSLGDVRRVLYRLPQLLEGGREGRTLYVVEGEKDVHALEQAGQVATCNPGGAGKWRHEYGEAFRGSSRVVIVADKDKSGRRHALEVAKSLDGIVPAVTIVQAATGKDASDHLAAGLGVNAFEPLEIDALGEDGEDADADDGRGTGRRSQADLLVALAETAEFFHHDDVAYVTADVDGHEETWRLPSKGSESWLRLLAHRAQKSAFSDQAIQTAIRMLMSRALFDGPEIQTAVRRVEADGVIWIDIGDNSRRVIKVTAHGWETRPYTRDLPIRFSRPQGLKALPTPVRGGDVAELRGLFNISDEEWPLFASCLVAYLDPRGPYPILNVMGEQGSAKSTCCQVIRALIDPNYAPVRRPPKNEGDLAVTSKNSAMLVIDNVSWVPDWLSDSLCSLATGAGWAPRAHYTNDEEALFYACRPTVLNGIGEIGTNADFLDRVVRITLPSLEEGRISKREFWNRFEEAAPRLVGVLLDALATGLRELPSVKIENPPRMADFAELAVASAPALGFDGHTFLSAYEVNRDQLRDTALDARPIAGRIIDLLFEEGGTWSGNAKALLERLKDPFERPPKGFPETFKALSNQIRFLVPVLRGKGIEADYKKHGRVWTFTLVDESAAETMRTDHRDDRDDRDDRSSSRKAPHMEIGDDDRLLEGWEGFYKARQEYSQRHGGHGRYGRSSDSNVRRVSIDRLSPEKPRQDQGI